MPVSVQLPQPQSRRSQMLEWLNYERRNWIALTLVAAMGGFFVGNGHTTQNAVQAIASKEGQDQATIHVLKKTVTILKSNAAPSKDDHPRHSGHPSQAQ